MQPARATICALASGAPPNAIAIIRVSGPYTQSVGNALLTKGVPPDREIRLDSICDAEGVVIDTGLCLFMAGPQSYTGEDTLELYLHGGRYIIEQTLEALFQCDVRMAEPGEFTRRAFEAGKFDLTRAEAVADLIHAETESQHKLARTQLGGALERLYLSWNQTLTEILALLEASIDFPDEEDAPDQVDGPVAVRLETFIETLKSSLERGSLTERIREGFRVVILGPPNAGKSSLLNRLADRPAAIVTDIPGTTRDIVEVRLHIGAYLVWVSDTAGLRQTSDPIEEIGVARAQEAAASADLRIWLHDVREPFEFGDQLRARDLVIANKIDLLESEDVSRETFPLSAATGEGIERLLSEVEERLDNLSAQVAAPTLTRARHSQGIQHAFGHLRRAQTLLATSAGAELISEEVRLASRAIASLTGQVETERILGAVFSTFCIGK